MASSQARQILVTGATGKQGGALINALLSSSAPTPFHLVALTRDAKTARAQALASKPNVSIIEGDFDDVNAIFGKFKQPFYGVFSIQTVQKGDVEEVQGKALVDAAIAHGVQHFVYSSVERGGFERSNIDPTPVPHFRTKHNIELHLKKAVSASSSPMKWTIIRPAAFMDNFTNDFIGKAFRSMWELNGEDSKMQVVAAQDVGVLAAEAFKNPDRYSSEAISLATDEITPRKADDIYRRVTGNPQPKTFSFLGRVLRWLLHKELGIMLTWFETDGFGADPAAMRKEFPQMLTFETWLATKSAFRRV